MNTLPQTDPRKGKPSASYIERMALCPGSWLASKGLPDLGGKDAASGTTVHAALSGDEDDENLSVDQVATKEEAAEIEREILSAFLSRDIIPDIVREKRLWFIDGQTPVFSGQLDFLAIGQDAEGKVTALIIDHKTGWNPSTAAEVNWQLAAQAVLVDHGYAIDRMLVAISQPNCKPRYTIAEYSPDMVYVMNHKIRKVIEAANQPDAPRVAGPKQCAYCPAKPHCPQAQAVVNAMAMVEVHPKNGEIVTGDVLSKLLERCGLAKKIIASIEAEAKRRLQAGEDVPGYQLKPGGKRESISNPNEVFQRFTALGGRADQFLPCVTVAKGKLKEAVREVTGEKGKALEAQFDTLVAGLTETKQNAPSLERVKA